MEGSGLGSRPKFLGTKKQNQNKKKMNSPSPSPPPPGGCPPRSLPSPVVSSPVCNFNCLLLLLLFELEVSRCVSPTCAHTSPTPPAPKVTGPPHRGCPASPTARLQPLWSPSTPANCTTSCTTPRPKDVRCALSLAMHQKLQETNDHQTGPSV